MQTPPAEKAPPGSVVGRWGPSVGPRTPAGRNVSTSRARFEAEVRGKSTRWRHRATGAGAPRLRGRLPSGPCKAPHLLGGRSLSPRPPGQEGALRGWRRGQASPHPQENITPSSLPPSLNFYHRISVRLSVSRSFCGSLPPSSPGTTDTGPQPSDLGGHRASHMPCPSLTPGG